MIDETAAAHVVRSRNRRKRPPTLRQRLVRLVALVLAIASVPVAYSYVTWMLRPSSLPFGIRSVEWVRASGGAWFVNDVERVYYRWRAPKPGGPPLKRLPAVGSTVAVRRFARRGGAAPARLPARIRPVVRPALPGEGVWQPAGALVGGHPAVLVAAFRPEATYPRNVAYVAWIDRTQTQVALYPGRYEPPAGAPRGAMQVPYGERWRLFATFNSGFTYRDGHGGFAINGHDVRAARTAAWGRSSDIAMAAWTWCPGAEARARPPGRIRATEPPAPRRRAVVPTRRSTTVRCGAAPSVTRSGSGAPPSASTGTEISSTSPPTTRPPRAWRMR